MDEKLKRSRYNLICKMLIFCMASLLAVIDNDMFMLPATADSISMRVSYGLENTARYGRSMLVNVELYEAASDMSGVVSVTFGRGGNKNNIRYSKDVYLTVGEAVTLSIPVDLYISYSDMLIVFESNENGIKTEQTISLNAYNYQRFILCGILTDNNDKSFYQDFGSKHYYLNESNIPDDFLGLDMLDIIIIEDYDTSKLSKKQQQALIKWLNNGGTLILSPGTKIGEYKNDGQLIDEKELYLNLNNDTEHLYQLKSAVESYERERLTNLAYNESVASEAKEPWLYYRYIGKEMISSSKIDENSIKPLYKKVYEINDYNTRILLSSNENVILHGKDIEKGLLVYSAIDILKSGIYKSPAESTVVESYFSYIILNSISKDAKLKLESEYSGFKFNNGWAVDVLTKPNDNRILSTKELGIIIAIYLLIAVPAVFIVLKRRHITKYIWTAIPLTSVLFTIFLYIISSDTRVKEPYFGYLDVEYFDNTKKEAYGSLDFIAGLNNNKAFSFNLSSTVKVNYSYDWIDGYFSTNYNNAKGKYTVPVDFNLYETDIAYKNDGLEVTINNLPAFQDVFYHADYMLEYEQKADGIITLKEDEIEGSIVNYSNEVIKDAFIIADTLYIPIGDIKSGEEAAITKDSSVALISADHAGYISRYTSEEYKIMPTDELRKSSSTQMALRETIGTGEYYLIGYLEEPAETNPLLNVCNTDKSFGTTVVVITIDEAEAVSEEGKFVSNIDQNISFIIEGNELDDMRYMTSKTFIASYSFPKDEKVKKLVFSEMLNNIPADSYYEIATEIYLYNIFTEEYDKIFDLEDDTKSRFVDENNLKKYISEDNSIIIKYYNNSMQSLCFLPIISCYKEVK